MMDGKQIWVIIAAYNEAETISDVLSSFSEFPYHIVVVDDGSKDNTSDLALKFPVTVLRHVTNLGQGAAIQTGLEYILRKESADCIVTFDADGQHDPQEIERLAKPVLSGEVDVALGSRFIIPDSAQTMPPMRKVMLKAAIYFTRLTTHLTLTDTHNGLRAFSVPAAKKINITSNRMAHASELLNQIAHEKMTYKEVPVNIHYSTYSLSKGQSILEFVNIMWEIISGAIR